MKSLQPERSTILKQECTSASAPLKYSLELWQNMAALSSQQCLLHEITLVIRLGRKRESQAHAYAVYLMCLLDTNCWFYSMPPRHFPEDASCTFYSSFRMKSKMHSSFSTSELFSLVVGMFILFRFDQTSLCCSH